MRNFWFLLPGFVESLFSTTWPIVDLAWVELCPSFFLGLLALSYLYSGEYGRAAIFFLLAYCTDKAIPALSNRLELRKLKRELACGVLYEKLSNNTKLEMENLGGPWFKLVAVENGSRKDLGIAVCRGGKDGFVCVKVKILTTEDGPEWFSLFLAFEPDSLERSLQGGKKKLSHFQLTTGFWARRYNPEKPLDLWKEPAQTLLKLSRN